MQVDRGSGAGRAVEVPDIDDEEPVVVRQNDFYKVIDRSIVVVV